MDACFLTLQVLNQHPRDTTSCGQLRRGNMEAGTLIIGSRTGEYISSRAE